MADQVNLDLGILPPPLRQIRSTMQNHTVNLGQISLTVQNAVVDSVNNHTVNILNDLPPPLMRIGSTTQNVTPSRPIGVFNQIGNNIQQPTIANDGNGTIVTVHQSSFYNNFPARFNNVRSTNGENASVSQHIQNTVYRMADKINSPEPEKKIKNPKRKVVEESEIDFIVSKKSDSETKAAAKRQKK